MTLRFDTPDGWGVKELQELCAKITDGTHHSPPADVQTPAGDFLYVTAKNIKEHGVDLTDVTYIPESVHRSIYGRCNPEQGDVLYIKDGVTTGIATVNQLHEPFSLLSSVALLKPRRRIVDPHFLKWWLNSPIGFRTMTSEMTGTAIRRLTLKKIKPAPVPVPSLECQRRIVEKIEELLSDLDAGVAALKRAQANLARCRAAVLKAAVEGELTKEWRREHPDVEPAWELLSRVLPMRRADNRVEPRLPPGWTWSTVAVLTDTAVIGLDRGRSRQRRTPPGTPYVKMDAVNLDGHIDFSRVTFVDVSETEAGKYSLQEGDLLFNTRNSIELVGKVGLVRRPPEGVVFNNNLMRIRTWVSPRWLCYYMCSRPFRERLAGAKRATTNVAAVYAKNLMPLPVALPPLAEQHVIADALDALWSIAFSQEATVRTSLERAQMLKRCILHKAFTGKILGSQAGQKR